MKRVLHLVVAGVTACGVSAVTFAQGRQGTPMIAPNFYAQQYAPRVVQTIPQPIPRQAFVGGATAVAAYGAAYAPRPYNGIAAAGAAVAPGVAGYIYDHTGMGAPRAPVYTYYAPPALAVSGSTPYMISHQAPTYYVIQR